MGKIACISPKAAHPTGPDMLAHCEMLTGNLRYFHNQMLKPKMAPSMALAVVASWYRMSAALDQRLPYLTAPMTVLFLVVVTTRWLSFVK